MSTVVKMLIGEVNVDDLEITMPGFITDFMDLKVRGPQKTTKAQAKNLIESSYNLPSSPDQLDTSTLSSETSAGPTATTFTLTYEYDQSIETKELSV